MRKKKRSLTRFGEKLHQLRLHHNMTLMGLAYSLGHSAHGHLSELEAGKKLPTVEFALKIADLYSVTTDELLKDELNLEITKSNKR